MKRVLSRRSFRVWLRVCLRFYLFYLSYHYVRLLTDSGLEIKLEPHLRMGGGGIQKATPSLWAKLTTRLPILIFLFRPLLCCFFLSFTISFFLCFWSIDFFEFLCFPLKKKYINYCFNSLYPIRQINFCFIFFPHLLIIRFCMKKLKNLMLNDFPFSCSRASTAAGTSFGCVRALLRWPTASRNEIHRHTFYDCCILFPRLSF